MWFTRLAAAAAGALFATSSLAQVTGNNTNSTQGQSTFVAPGGAILFGLTTDTESSQDVYVSIQMPVQLSWGAIGLGSSQMAGSLILMIYMNKAGDNVTFSPRVAYGEYEPQYFPDMEYEVLEGTGIFNDTMCFSMRCYNYCRHWPNGYIDITDPNQNAIFAIGPGGAISSDAPDAPVRMHEGYGTFSIDMKRTNGLAAVPLLSPDSANEGVSPGTITTNVSDMKATGHAALMVFCFAILIPFGILIVRLGEWFRWHAWNQGIAVIGITAGAVLGIMTSFRYQRSRHFDSPHQVIGIIAVLLIYVQFIIGFLNHRGFKRTQQPTKLRKPHVWLGRFTILLGIINGFIGFPFALTPQWDYLLTGIVVIVFPFVACVTWWRSVRNKRRAENPGPNGYDPEPWMNANPNQQVQVGLADLDSEGRKERKRGLFRNNKSTDLGAAVSAREFA